MGPESSYMHCEAAMEVSKTLTDIGKIWINSLVACFMKEMTELYKAETLDCNSVFGKAKNIQQHCYTSNDFCGVGWDNREALWKIFQRPMNETKSDYYMMLWKNLGMMSSKCTTKNAPELTSWINSKAEH
ncbi:uncharacterized protein LOC106879340 [Octopus bimaculoides]|uniref:uncharacterized protein LOC106879340 n=1 Tax=Octopus bimaculoides TaxID=37653 RepID=UPI00071D2A1F|nr:uncharacterized protein LOC106879340 [Octopus bimaculoides]|eukprot:XP_014784336.1 PREDICTED: uncharacterized protein LOC106879340 [Octopus bimaculoides]